VAIAWLHRASTSAAFLRVELTVSRDAGAHFSPPELVPGTGDPLLGAIGSRQGKLMRLLAANPAGMVAVASSSYRDSHSSRIRVLRGHVR
jgi:hypothetical protein